MIANLPLLFANGNPKALSKTTAAELEKFITFMVTCSWGHDTAKDIRKPPWWPRDIEFHHPFKRPFMVPRNWEEKLKDLVRKCYNYHKSAFLLVFSAQLSRYPRKRLRYVNNRDHTTSLYYNTPNGKLLVTFRNENITYDQDEESKSDIVEESPQSADIYLCDNCDSHFDNFSTFTAHERLCYGEVPASTVSGGLPEFLSALKLQPAGTIVETTTISDNAKSKSLRTSANVDRGPPYPFSSLAYTKNFKNNIQRDSTFSRERIERFCNDTPKFSKNAISRTKGPHFPVRYKRPVDYWYRKHVFPDQRNKKILDVEGQLLMLKCRPVKVKVEQMSMEDMQAYIENLEEQAKLREEQDIEFVNEYHPVQDMDCDSTADPLTRMEDEIIDLCSDDESTVNENCDPKAAVTCVMRGGAVLRRTAATPQQIPAEPCGARQKPLPILQPQPVILFSHSLSNCQTIALD